MEISDVIIATGLIIFLIYKFRKRKNANKIETVEVDFMTQRLNKGVEDYNLINSYLKHIQDEEILMLGNNLQKKSIKILVYLKNNHHCLPSSRQFIEYYQDRTASLIRQCVTLEQTGINNQDSKRIIKDTKEVLIGFLSAYDAEFAKIMNSHIAEMDAELTVARQMLENDGVKKGPSLLQLKEQNMKKEKEKYNNETASWLTPKTVGGAFLAVLGAVGLYKVFNSTDNKNKKNES